MRHRCTAKPRTRRATGAALLGLLFVAASAVGERRPSGAEALARAKAELMAADYAADVPRLVATLDAIRPWLRDGRYGALAHYWAGFAHWRAALNGANRALPADEIDRHLRAAAAELDASAARDRTFADAIAAAASVNGWLAMRHRAEPDAFRRYAGRANDLLRRAVALAPDNPRVLWVEGGSFLFRPRAAGGDPARAVELYERGARPETAPADPASPLPDWGRVENVMSLAFAKLQEDPPQTAAARRYAHAALMLRPDWFYVRAVLLPQIERADRALPFAVTLDRVPGRRVLWRTIVGPYTLHAEAIASLLVAAHRSAPDGLIGVYPYDPSVIAPAELEWALAMPVEQERELTAQERASGYAWRTLPGAPVAVLSTVAERAADAGRFLLRWLPDHGYALAGPTRIRYAPLPPGLDPTQAALDIEVPLRSLDAGSGGTAVASGASPP